MRRSVIPGYLTLVLATLPGLPAVASASKKEPSAMPLAAFVETLKNDGRPTAFPSILQRLGGFPAGSTKKALEARREEVVDGIGRVADIVYQAPSNTEEPIPIGLYWQTRRVFADRSETYIYHTSLEGILEKAVRSDAKPDESGRDIRGSGKATDLDVHSKEVRERFQHEVLDFWLKGVGRKAAGSKAAAAPQPARQ